MLERMLIHSSFVWPMALICAALSSAILYLIIQAGLFGEPKSYFIVGKIAGFVGLGYWARGWSMPAAILVLAWHLWTNSDYLFADKLPLKMHFWIPSLVFGWAIMQTWMRGKLICKARAIASSEEES